MCSRVQRFVVLVGGVELGCLYRTQPIFTLKLTVNIGRRKLCWCIGYSKGVKGAIAYARFVPFRTDVQDLNALCAQFRGGLGLSAYRGQPDMKSDVRKKE